MPANGGGGNGFSEPRDAIIFDLRDNTGGYPSMVALIAGYLFAQPTHLNDMYNRGENSTLQSWTPQPVLGNRLANRPLMC